MTPNKNAAKKARIAFVMREYDNDASSTSYGSEAADKTLAERVAGLRPWRVSALGQKKRLRTFIDASATAHATILVSGGRRGLDIEIAPADLARMTLASFATLMQ